MQFQALTPRVILEACEQYTHSKKKHTTQLHTHTLDISAINFCYFLIFFKSSIAFRLAFWPVGRSFFPSRCFCFNKHTSILLCRINYQWFFVRTYSYLSLSHPDFARLLVVGALCTLHRLWSEQNDKAHTVQSECLASPSFRLNEQHVGI